MCKYQHISVFLRNSFIAIALFTSGCTHNVDLKTIHLGAPIYGDWNADGGHIYIKGTLGGSGTVQFDKNSCTEVTEFGDSSYCTLMYFYPIDVTIEQIEIEDPLERGRKVYQLVGNLPNSDYEYYLVVPSSQESIYRLVVDDGTAVGGRHQRRVVTLEMRN